MLLNASHKLSFSGLPPDLLDAYVRYKKSTRALLTWFLQHSPTPDKPVKSLTIKDLESLAQVASKKIRSLPDVVHFYFRETISDRKKFSKYYRSQVGESSDDVETINHEHFTETQVRKSPSTSPVCQPLRPVNLYEGLTVEDVQDHEGQTPGGKGPSGQSKPISSPPSASEGQDLDICLADDDLGNALELAAVAQQIHDISRSVEQYWRLVGEGTLSLASASFITNVAFALLRQVVSGLLQHDEDFSLADLRDLCSSKRAVGQSEGGAEDPTRTTQALLDRLGQIEQNLSDVSNGKLPVVNTSCASCGHKEAQEAQRRVIKEDAGSQYLSPAIIEKLVLFMNNKATEIEVIKTGTPVYWDVCCSISNSKNTQQSWLAVLGMNLLVQSTQSFLRSIPQPQMASQGRIVALKLAHQARFHLTTILKNKGAFPCRCPQTLACHLHDLESQLHGYASYNCWDLVFQSPWVAGNHALEMVDLCHYYGLHLLKYRHYVGAVLHSYNVLRQLGGLEEIPILESLCVQFGEVMFPANKAPKSNFRTCWARHVGARLKFEQGHKGRNRHDNWCLAIPAHAAKAAAGFDIPTHHHKHMTGCVLFRYKHQNYYISDAQIQALNPPIVRSRQGRGEWSTTRMCKADVQIVEAAGQNPKLLPLALATHRLITTGNCGLLPMARVNLIALFERCLSVVSQLSDKMHSDKEAEKGINCICFCSEIFSAADRIVKGRRMGKLEAWNENERKLIEDTKEAIQKTFGSLTKEDLLWSI
ncbi:uncharacterized protein Z520_07084 [Fonsecaea multimorphosa CBS 102226]|uniref:DUF6604 domain-containing protein n=1 Tax=Fonsecaea multimorphosa CBS 102226 TaxID=1442371 RepID=A0A0D2H572_9EURO|nr:uncharacterized protein Z520_07084 [Fonsecaea multimorphosa CBS 102226]KIX96970.1 hypothetical protein Z520_07084 [Fonsecaea multimorphosa CBS 102226]OAL23047.1 hypothetical protein AYO22_06661 [Fonsecaea multimorphosa]